MALPWVVAVPVALAAAGAFGSAAYLQHEAARQAPPRGPLRPRLIWDLLKIRGFRWSIALSIAGFGLQVGALSLAPLALVQPLLVSQLICYLLLVSLRTHRTPDRALLGGAALAAAGLATFLLVSRPASPPPGAQIGGLRAFVLGAVLIGVVALALVVASRLRSEARAVPLAVACAVCYGVTAGLIRSLSTTGWSHAFSQWELYAIVVVAPAGFLLNQKRLPKRPAGLGRGRHHHRRRPDRVGGGRRGLAERDPRRRAGLDHRTGAGPVGRDRRDLAAHPPRPGRGRPRRHAGRLRGHRWS